MPEITRRRVGHLWIKDCQVRGCKSEGRWHYHRLNPKGQAMKAVEMTVVRALKAIEAFDELDKDQDWTDVPAGKWVDILGDRRYTAQRLAEELWARYKTRDRQLHRQVLDLAENLVWDDLPAQRRKELKSGIARVRKAIDS